MRDGQSVEFHGDACDDDDDGDEYPDMDERERGTGVRNVDTDDDGLTDGQEMHGLTQVNNGVVIEDSENSFYTEPDNLDTDGDGYWDGWIGVYDVGQTDNVILYREHLQEGNGITSPDNIVQEQVGTHRVYHTQIPHPEPVVPAAMSADVDDDDWTEHSNVHIGELHWGTHPDDGGHTPDPSLRIEVDYHSDIHPALQTEVFRESIEDNYALYGIDIEFVDAEYSDTLEPSDLIIDGTDHTQPFNDTNVSAIRNEYQDTDSLYMFVGNVSEDVPNSTWSTGQGGINSDWPYSNDLFIALFSHGLTQQGRFNSVPSSRLNLNRSEQVRAIALGTAVHEIGHALDAGAADDGLIPGSGCCDEVYSGSSDDPSREDVYDKTQGEYVQAWNALSLGTTRSMFLRPTNERYVAFSIEELSTINNIGVEEDN